MDPVFVKTKSNEQLQFCQSLPGNSLISRRTRFSFYPGGFKNAEKVSSA